jgi:4a-hydroxytetrahydrobiopterin dehydratase
MSLADEKSRTIQAGEQPLSKEETSTLAHEVPGWSLTEGRIEREFRFPGFEQAMAFANKVAEIAEQEDHHPDIFIAYNTVRLTLSTHRIGGLSRNDFIVAAKIDRLV